MAGCHTGAHSLAETPSLSSFIPLNVFLCTLWSESDFLHFFSCSPSCRLLSSRHSPLHHVFIVYSPLFSPFFSLLCFSVLCSSLLHYRRTCRYYFSLHSEIHSLMHPSSSPCVHFLNLLLFMLSELSQSTSCRQRWVGCLFGLCLCPICILSFRAMT